MKARLASLLFVLILVPNHFAGVVDLQKAKLQNDFEAGPFAVGEILNVKRFGAVGDGVTDDYEAFASAFESISKGTLGTIYIPSGRYRINSTLKLPNTLSGLTIRETDPADFFRSTARPRA